MATNEDLMHAIQEIHKKLDKHIEDEEPVLDSAKILIATHGTDEMIRSRINFVNEWMERERDRKALRRAIIEKTFTGAIWALLIYLAIVIRHDLLDIVRGVKDAAEITKP